MRIVYIEDFFHPDAGYQINLLSKYWASFGHDVIIFSAEAEKTPKSLTSFFDYTDLQKKDRLFEENYNVQVFRFPIYRVISGRAVFKPVIFRKIKELHPDIVYVNGNDSLVAMQLTLRASKTDYKLVMDSHMLEMASRNKYRELYRAFYRKVITPIILKNKIPVIRTQDDDYIEKCLGIPLSYSPVISFGSDTLNFHPDSMVRGQFRQQFEINDNAFVITYAGKLNYEKGVDLLRDALTERFDTNRDVVFLIIGAMDASIPDAEHFFDHCENRIIRFPTQKYPDLPKFYQASDLAVFPKQCSLSFYDVQACGLPVVFENNPLNATRSKRGNAITFQSNNVTDFREKIILFSNMEQEQYNEYRDNSIRYIKDEYDYRDKAKEYIHILESQL